MRYRLRDVPAMLATPVGRLQVRQGVAHRLWPLLACIAALHRRTLARRVQVVAVVGSLGKSTTVRAVVAALAAPAHPGMLRNAFSSVAAALLRLRPGQRWGVLEVGIAAPGQMESYARLVRPDVVVVTSIASEHHRSLGTLAVTRAEKAWMLRALPPTGVAVVNGDDANVRWMAGETRARVVTFGFDETCDVRARDVTIDWPHGMRFTVEAFGETHVAHVRLIGRHFVYPVLAAVAVARFADVPVATALTRVAALAPTPGRMEPVALRNGAIVLRDDFKSTGESVHVALEALAEIPAQRRIVLLGDVSEPDGTQSAVYQAIGEHVAAVATQLFIAASRKSAERYATGARRGGMATAAITAVGHSAREAARALERVLQPGDVLLVKGRDTQRLDRVRLIMQGRDVRCDIAFCSLRMVACAQCPMLERGWRGRRPVM